MFIKMVVLSLYFKVFSRSENHKVNLLTSKIFLEVLLVHDKPVVWELLP